MLVLLKTQAVAMKWVLQLFLFLNFPFFLHAVDTDYSSAKVSTKWVNNDFNSKGSSHFADGSTLRTVLLNISTLDPSIGCGFYGNPNTNTFYFTVFVVELTSDFKIFTKTSPQILWTANRANPVKENATLDFTKYGDLMLRDADGTFVWSSDTSSMKITQMIICQLGTLVLADSSYVVIWQSWEYSTDTWLPGQALESGQRLIASVSASNWTPGPYYLSFVDNQLSVFIESNFPQIYYNVFKLGSKSTQSSGGYFSLIGNSTSTSTSTSLLYQSAIEDFQYMRLDPDGHLRVYEWVHRTMSPVDDIFIESLQSCENLTVCGKYGICSDGQCSCPAENEASSYFKKSNESLECLEVTALSCQSSLLHSFIELKEVSYFGFVTTLPNTDIESCKRACLKNCSCKAALFRYKLNTSSGNCSLPSQIFSLMSMPQGAVPYNSTSFIKVQSSPPIPNKKSNSMVFIAGYIIAASIFAFLVISACVGIMRKRRSLKEKGRENNVDVEWENSLNLPTRFTYEYLKSATDNFHTKLGGGGFGSVYAGTLSDGTNIAVKCLDRFGQGEKEFVAEVKTIGCIHHVNLVRLMGFCAENSHRLLVYEYMGNSSLDKWIFNENPENALPWEIRKKTILNIAKGLAYLHEECRMRIAHLDIKPQNILLDDDFNAKLSDFGLARLIDRNQNQVTTQMRGTRGYMAPEWLSRKITEKVDVYSFGVVILEVICGRRNMDFSQFEENDHLLLPIVKQKAEENRLYDLVHKCSEDMQKHSEEAEKMLRVAIWCLQSDSTRRPSMSTVVKVLEGVMVAEPISDYSFLTSIVVEAPIKAVFIPSNPQPALVLSGPR